MHNRHSSCVLCVLIATSLIGCATVDPQPDYVRARQFIKDSTGVETLFDPDAALMTDAQMDAVLADGLTIDEAVRLALVNNQGLHADFMSIGVAKADWVQSGLLSNPSLGFSILFPEGGGRSFVEASLAQNLIDLWQIPIRKSIARHELDAVVLDVARKTGQLAADTRRVYFEAVAAAEQLKVAGENMELIRKSYNAIRAKREAGAATLLDENLALAQVHVVEVEIRTARLETTSRKRKLARLLSLDRDVSTLALADPLPLPTTSQPSLADLVVRARRSRLDLRSLESSLKAAGVQVDFEKSKLFGDVSAGIAGERNERRAGDGNGIDEKFGPTISLEIPIFDQNQARTARARYLADQIGKTYRALYIAVAQDIYLASDRLQSSADTAIFYRDTLVPQAEQNLTAATQSYGAGQITLLSLLESQRSILEARRAYIESRAAAATAQVDLDLAVGVPDVRNR